MLVVVILDKSQQGGKNSLADFLVRAGLRTYIDSRHAIAHNKVMLFDHATLITGSFNFTKAAEEKNAENLLVLKGSHLLVVAYMWHFVDHLKHSTPHVAR